MELTLPGFDLGVPLTRRAEALAKQPELGESGANREIVNGFEAVFLSLLLKEMRQTLSEGGLFGSESSDTYGGIFDLFLGQHLADSGGLGIGRMIEQYLSHRSLDE